MDEPKSYEKYFVEGLGTFMLVWIGPGAAVVAGLIGLEGLGGVLAIALAFGFVVAAAIYVLGRASGCLINPAVAVALLVTRRISWQDAAGYIVAQLIGAVVASLLFVACLGTQAATDFNLGGTYLNSGAGVTMIMGFLGEAIGTFILMLTIMGVCVDKEAPAGWCGWIVGMIVAGVIITLGPMTGSSINPARTFGPYVGNMIFGGNAPWDQFLVVYTLGPIVGAVVAAFAWDFGHRSQRVQG
jgi:glycerol uptake facilitator protein